MKYWGRNTTSISNPNWDEITNKPSILNDNQINWGEIQGKPTTFDADKLILSNTTENIRVKKFTGNLPNIASARQAMVQHGVNDSTKILGITALLNFSGLLIPPNYALGSGYEYNIVVDSSWLSGATYTATRSSQIYGRTVSILIFYLG